MNIMMTLTVKHIRNNMKRTIITVFGIVAATALITAMLTGIYSVFSFVADVSIIADGNWQAIYEDADDAALSYLKNDSRIEMTGVANDDLTISGFQMDTGASDRLRVGNIYHADHQNLIQMVTCDYEGTLPESEDEIAVEEKLLKENGLTIGIGDELTFTQGYRSIMEEGKIVYLAGAYRSAESFTAKEVCTCKVTAILHENKPTSSFRILRGIKSGNLPAENKTFITLKKPDVWSVHTIDEITQNAGAKLSEINTEYLMSIFAFDLPYNTVKAVFRLMGLALAIIIVSSVIMIYNTFAMSLTERMKYLGMLASVGATKKQKRASVYYEGFLMGLIGIPIGFLVGLLGCFATLRFVGTLIIDSKMVRGISVSMQNIPVKIHPLIILLVIFFAGLTILLSSLLPAIRASKITPIEALRQSNDIKLKAKRLRVFPLVRLLFGYEGELASKNSRRNGKKGTVITISMAVSIIMFLCSFYFMDLFNKANAYEIEIPFQVFASAALDEADRLKEDLSRIDGVSNIYVAEMISFSFLKTDEEGKPRITPNEAVRDPAFLTKNYQGLFERDPSIWVIPVEDETFRQICEKNGIDDAKYFGDTLCGVLLNNYNHKKSKKAVFNDGILGQRLFYDDPKGNPPAVTITDFVSWDDGIDEYKLSPKGSISVYVPVSKFHEAYVKNVDRAELQCTFGLQCADHEAVQKKAAEILEFDGYHNTSSSDIESELIIMKTLITVLKTVMYGFVFLIALIVIANIINTICTGMQLRKKEFAMYKSVGMTDRGFSKMLFLETFLIGIRALLIGLPVSALLSFMMYKNLSAPTVAFELSLPVYLLAATGVFVVVGIGMLIAAPAMRQGSVIDVLKEDIC